MLERDVQEWEEYDARLLDGAPFAPGALETERTGRRFRPTRFDAPDDLDSPFLVGDAGEITANTLSASVGRRAANRPADVRLVQRLINANLPVPLAPLSEDGVCGPKTVFAIETYQRRTLEMNPPDGRVDPGGATFRSLAGDVEPQHPAPSGLNTTPATANTAGPSNMRPAAWSYLLAFTKKHEGAVFHMYNNRPANSQVQDVTCGVGFLLSPRGVVTQPWVKNMFFDPATNQAPSDDQMFADWDAAAALARTANNLGQYAVVCLMRMHPDRVYNQLAVILRDQKLPALLSTFPDDFRNFSSFPSAAQVFCVSFAYGRIPIDFPRLRAAIRDGRWADAAKECHLHGASELKNQAHAQLLMLAQRVVDQNLDPDTLPALAGAETHELEGAANEQGLVAFELDPYASIRSGMAPEHVDLVANEVTGILGDRPAALALHELLNSPTMQQATVASVLGDKGRRSVHVNGRDISIPAYLRLVSRLCGEVSEQGEGPGGKVPTSPPVKTPADPAPRGIKRYHDDVSQHMYYAAFNLAIQGAAGRSKLTAQQKAILSDQIADAYVKLFWLHKDQTNCAKDAANDDDSKAKLDRALNLEGPWGSAFNGALQTTSGSEKASPEQVVKEAADIADQAVLASGELDESLWNLFMKCKKP
jgi:hypothetical protein